VAVGLDLQDHVQHPHALHRLVECLGGLHRHLAADARHFQKFRRPLGVGLFRLPLGQIREAQRVGLHRVQRDQDRAVEVALLQVLKPVQLERIQRGLRVRADARQPLFERAAVVHRDVRVARGDVALGLDDAQVVVKARALGEGCVALVLKRAALPVGVDFVAQDALVLLGDGEAVAVALVYEVQLLDHPIHRVFGEDGRGAVAAGLISQEQRVGVDVDGHVPKHVVQHPGAL